ncbi:AbrB/MazE/SpoVT family DNA-binding domain-containing protein [Pyrodictium abyssi]|uniref:AbrB/MazE/SpoVT family DNA-binding domain-containing protein n=1 Tax=Pyrodictium abyssi TaxID=54256 RepID=A0ABM8IZJ9_9CREN|nr:AbrB/MazE/SpoVT family DNA-binding domain-containing protein [Pyrodictium abyssi]
MGLVARTRVGRKNMLYIPKSIAEAVGIKEGTVVKLRVKDNKVVIEVVPDPFELALRYPKFAKTSFEEFEKESEEMQGELLGEQD